MELMALEPMSVSARERGPDDAHHLLGINQVLDPHKTLTASFASSAEHTFGSLVVRGPADIFSGIVADFYNSRGAVAARESAAAAFYAGSLQGLQFPQSTQELNAQLLTLRTPRPTTGQAYALTGKAAVRA